jgi:hypothetical protein
MRDIRERTGTLEIIKRLKSSTNGNPRYLLKIDGLHCSTAVDSSYGYCVTNYDGKPIKATIGTHYGTVTLNSLKPLED